MSLTASKKNVTTSRGEVHAIGEFKIRKSEKFPYEIPRLSYIVTRESKNTYASTCIDLHIDGDGSTPDEAEENMGNNVFEFLCANFAGKRGNRSAWDYLEELFSIDENSKESWDAFNRFKLYLAKKGINTDVASSLIERMSGLNGEIDRLNKLDITKEKIIKKCIISLYEQKKEIEKLEQEKMVIQEVAKQTTVALQMLRNYETYNTYWR